MRVSFQTYIDDILVEVEAKVDTWHDQGEYGQSDLFVEVIELKAYNATTRQRLHLYPEEEAQLVQEVIEHA